MQRENIINSLRDSKMKMNLIYSVCAVVSLFLSADIQIALAAGSLSAKTDELFVKWDRPDSPGAALAIVKDGSVVYKRGYGSANLEYDIAIDPTSVFDIKSASKQFTAFAIAMLVHEGKLSLDDDIRKHLPELPDFGETITVRHLIHHTSGLRCYTGLYRLAGWWDFFMTNDDILEIYKHQKELNFSPGDEYTYCSYGYTLLAEIVEHVTGLSFREYTEMNIFKPLDMTKSHFHDDREMIVKNRAYGYEPTDRGFEQKITARTTVGHSKLFTTVDDLAKWVLNFESGKVGGPAVIEQMHQRGVLNNRKILRYAFGQVFDEYKGLKIVRHGGSGSGYRSYIIRFPEQRFAVIVLSNLESFEPGKVARQVADIYLADYIVTDDAESEQEQLPSEGTDVKLDPATYDSLVGTYRVGPGHLIEIMKENNRLFSQGNRGKKELFPGSENRFFSKATNTQISFQQDSTGRITQLTLHVRRRNTPAPKFEPLVLNASQLVEYAGDYYSDELCTTYTLIVRDDQLVAEHRKNEDTIWHRKNEDTILRPAEKDTFSARFFGQVQFTRNDEGAVTGFQSSSGRVRNLRFNRQTH